MTGTITSLQSTRRLLNTAAFLLCAGLLSFGYYLQFHEGLDPCPLCIFQRIAFMATGLLFLAAAIHAPGRTGSRIYAVLISLAGLTGAGSQSGTCGCSTCHPGRCRNAARDSTTCWTCFR